LALAADIELKRYDKSYCGSVAGWKLSPLHADSVSLSTVNVQASMRYAMSSAQQALLKKCVLPPRIAS
jgi:hypothetical protein